MAALEKLISCAAVDVGLVRLSFNYDWILLLMIDWAVKDHPGLASHFIDGVWRARNTESPMLDSTRRTQSRKLQKTTLNRRRRKWSLC